MHVFLFSMFKSVRLCLISLACITLVACGGGGGSGSSPTPVVVIPPEPTPTPSPVPSDTSPDAFTLSVEADAELNEEFTVDVSVSGIDTETDITISGSGGEYKIDDGDYTTASSMVVNGQTVTVRATASDTYATLREITLSIGDQSDVFSVTTRDAIITPADFAFTATTDADPDSDNESNSITVADIEIPVAISITGGEYKIDEGDYTAAEGTVSADQVVTVRVTASNSFATDTTASLTIGDKTADYVVTTREADAIADTFTFIDEVDAAVSEPIVSNAVVISGLEVSTTITVTGGEYNIDGGDFTSEPGSIGPESTSVVVRGTASNLYGTETDVVLTIGESVSDTFTITTIADTTAPVATIAFPPPASMTQGENVFIRGTVVDDLSGAATVFIDVSGVMTEAPITETDGVYSWQTTVALTEGDNVLKVITTDVGGNEISDEEAESVNVKRDTAYGDFPDSNVPFSYPVGIAVDYVPERNRIIVGDRGVDALIAVDRATGIRTVLSNSLIDDLANPFASPEGLLIDTVNDRIWVGDISADTVFEVDLKTGVRQVKSSDTVPDTSLEFSSPREMIVDPLDSNRLIITDQGGLKGMNISDGSKDIIIGVTQITQGTKGIVYNRLDGHIYLGDASSGIDGPPGTVLKYVISEGEGELTVLSPPEVDLPLQEVTSIALDIERDRLLVNDRDLPQILQVDLETGARSMFSNPTFPNAINPITKPEETYFDEGLGYALTVDDDSDALFAIDITTGYRVVLSKATAPEL